MSFKLKKVFQNKRTKQFSVTIPSKKLKAITPIIKTISDFHKKIEIIVRRKKDGC